MFREKYKELFIQNKMGFWELDVATGEFKYDDSIRALYDIPKEQSVGKLQRAFEMTHPEDLPILKKQTEDIIADNPRPDNVAFRITTYAGVVKFLRATGMRIFNDQGVVTKILGMSWDITEYRKLEMDLAEKSKMATLGEVTSEIAHSVNNNLNIITGRTALLKAKVMQDQYDKEKTLEYIESIEKNAMRIGYLTKELNTFSKSNNIETEAVMKKFIADIQKRQTMK